VPAEATGHYDDHCASHDHYSGPDHHYVGRHNDDHRVGDNHHMAQSVDYSILVGPAGYIILDVNTANVLSGDARRVAAIAFRDAIINEYPDDRFILRPDNVRLIADDGTTISTYGDAT
jgi:hypothetical protein